MEEGEDNNGQSLEILQMPRATSKHQHRAASIDGKLQQLRYGKANYFQIIPKLTF